MTKETAPKETKPSAEKPAKNASGFEGDNFFWGALLIGAGALFLLHNLGIIQLYIGNIWQLWPVVIILIGVSFMQLKGVWSIILNVIATLVIIALLFVTLTNENGLRQGPVTHEGDDIMHVEKRGTPWQKVEHADVRVDTGAISLQLGAITEGDTVANAQLEGSRKITEETTLDGATQRVTFGTKGHPGFGVLQGKNRLNLQLTRQLPIDLTLDMGASAIKGDLSEVQLRTLLIDSGASSIDLKLGSKQDRSNITIDTGASSVKLRIPKEVGYRIERDGGLSRGKFAGTKEVGEGRYETDGFANATKQITIKADTGATAFTIEQY